MSDAAFGVGVFVFMVGLADSANPSTVAPAMALAIQEKGARRAAAFTAGVAAVSVVCGVVLVAGPGEALISAIPHPGSLAKHIGEVVLGAVLIGLAVAAWMGRHRLARSLAEDSGKNVRGSAALALGAGIMAVELPTAFPYFAAIVAIIGTHTPLPERIFLVLVFNLAFVVPLLAIVGLRIVAGDGAAERLGRLRAWLASRAGVILAVLLGIGGVALLVVGIVGL